METDWRELLRTIGAGRLPPPQTLEKQAIQLVRTAVQEGRLADVAALGPVVREAYPRLAERIAQALPGIVVNHGTALAEAVSDPRFPMDRWQRESPAWRESVSQSFLTGRLVQVVDALAASVTRRIEQPSAAQA